MKTFLRSLLVTLALIAAVLLLPGCVQTSLRTPDGFTFTTLRPVWSGSISAIEVQGQDFNISVQGYQSDQAQTLEAIAAGVARGLTKPTP